PYFTAPFFVKNIILTIHDIIPAVFRKDFGILKYLYYKIYVQILVFKSNFILTDSDYSKKEIIRFFKVKKEKVRRIYLYNFDNSKYINNPIKPSLKNPYFIYVGNMKKYKNADVIVDSIVKLRNKGIKVDLILVGNFRDYNLDFVHIKSNISKEELYGLYEHSIALLYPSLCEGFGLPLVEAMSIGIPIIASNRSSIPEVIGDAGLLIEPVESEFMKAMELILVDEQLQNKLGEKSFKRKSAFSYKKFKNNLCKMYATLQEELNESRNRT
ncbi:glycosyltransferase family 1 protein, partial [Butyricicoccus sp. 1XD8-22]